MPSATAETPMGHQRPRISHIPPSLLNGNRVGVTPQELVSPIGREVADLSRLAGLELDPWQMWVMDHAMAQNQDTYWNPYTERYENKWAAFEVGLVVSRQNGKGSILEARELAGLFLLGERLIIHSAHQFDTSKEAFSRILYLVENTPDLDAEVARVSRSHGEEGIELRNGQRLRFRTRTKGGGRGFTGDCLILDEAMYLGAQQVGALMPTLSARPAPQLWYTGSAGDQESTQLGRVRNRALKGDDPRLFYAEWSIDYCDDFCPKDCDEHDQVDSVESYARANPGLGIRITVEHIEAERRSMDPATFLQERLGVGDWPDDGEGWHVISEEHWNAAFDEESRPGGMLSMAVDTTPDRSYSAIAIAGLNEDGRTHIEIPSDGVRYDHHTGTKWVVDRVVELYQRWKPVSVVIDPASQAGSFVDELESRGVKVVHPKAREYAQACGAFHSAVVPRRGESPALAHVDQVPLNNAVAGAEKRDLADTWAWSKRGASVDISPLVASTLAFWGLHKKLNEPKVRARMAWG